MKKWECRFEIANERSLEVSLRHETHPVKYINIENAYVDDGLFVINYIYDEQKRIMIYNMDEVISIKVIPIVEGK